MIGMSFSVENHTPLQPDAPRLAKVQANISLRAVRDNYLTVKKAVTAARICCVVKADAYGHGAEAVCKTLSSLGVTDFAVSSVAEAVQVRNAVGSGAQILILGYTLPQDADLLLQYGITQTVFSIDYARVLSQAVERVSPDAKLPIHIKVDTGMNRLGFAADDAAGIADACRLPGLEHTGIFTHFVMSDEPDKPMTQRQFDTFMQLTEQLEKAGITFATRHVCNSAAIFNFPHMHLDMVRLGISLYGLAPSAQTAAPPLKPAMTVQTVISHIHELCPGDTVSYGAVYQASAPMRIATVPIGYADGYIRAYARQGYMAVCGSRARIVGRICMDQCMIDITHIPAAAVGTPVTVFGGTDPTADTLAAWSDTINYEVTCIIGKRVPRFYESDG